MCNSRARWEVVAAWLARWVLGFLLLLFSPACARVSRWLSAALLLKWTDHSCSPIARPRTRTQVGPVGVDRARHHQRRSRRAASRPNMRLIRTRTLPPPLGRAGPLDDEGGGAWSVAAGRGDGRTRMENSTTTCGWEDGETERRGEQRDGEEANRVDEARRRRTRRRTTGTETRRMSYQHHTAASKQASKQASSPHSRDTTPLAPRCGWWRRERSIGNRIGRRPQAGGSHTSSQESRSERASSRRTSVKRQY